MASAAAVSMGMGSLNFGLFIKPMGDELGISRATFGWASTARQVSSAGTSPFVGSLLDRFGSRVMLPVSAAITVAAMIGLGYMHSAWQLIALFSLMGLVGMSGPGALVTTVPVMKWFVRNRGKAIAYTSLGVPLGALIFLPLTQVLIDAWGWRTAWIVLGIIGGAIIIPLSIIFVRRQPEDMGLQPDGDVAEEVEEGSDPTAPVFAGERSWTTAEAVRSPVFWRLVAVFSLVALGVGTVGVHRIPAFQDRGLDAGVISIAAALDAVAAGAATFTMGMLVRRVAVRYLGAAGFGFLGDSECADDLHDHRDDGLCLDDRVRPWHRRDAVPAELHMGRVLRQGTPGLDPRPRDADHPDRRRRGRACRWICP
ncbi:MAG: MFS transporter [Chloroflexi bacterium]|nr:MFS transporter [Chloroflexota bacterium]MDA1297067.1 MFS transporter [Chloroflexota bacterium]